MKKNQKSLGKKVRSKIPANSYRRFSKKHYIIFAIALAGIGATALIYTRAATINQSVLFEAESFSIAKSHNRPVGFTYPSSSANAGKAMMVHSNGSISKKFNLGRDYGEIMVRAAGDDCHGQANMVVNLDGKDVIKQTVSSVWRDYGSRRTIPKGNHTLKISFTNDHYHSRSCDRNLKVDRVQFVKRDLGVSVYECTYLVNSTYHDRYLTTSNSCPANYAGPYYSFSLYKNYDAKVAPIELRRCRLKTTTQYPVRLYAQSCNSEATGNIDEGRLGYMQSYYKDGGLLSGVFNLGGAKCENGSTILYSAYRKFKPKKDSKYFVHEYFYTINGSFFNKVIADNASSPTGWKHYGIVGCVWP